MQLKHHTLMIAMVVILGMGIHLYQGEVWIDDGTGFKARLYKDNDNNYIVSFAGTEDAQDAYQDVANFGWGQWESKRGEILNFFKGLSDDGDLGSVVFTGHSLGGALAQYAAYDIVSESIISGESSSIITFNGLGGVSGLQEQYGADYNESILNNSSIYHYYNPYDLVVQLSEHVGGKSKSYELKKDNGVSFFVDAHLMSTIEESIDNNTVQIDVQKEHYYFKLDNAVPILQSLGNLTNGWFYGGEYEANTLESTTRLISITALIPLLDKSPMAGEEWKKLKTWILKNIVESNSLFGVEFDSDLSKSIAIIALDSAIGTFGKYIEKHEIKIQSFAAVSSFLSESFEALSPVYTKDPVSQVLSYNVFNMLAGRVQEDDDSIQYDELVEQEVIDTIIISGYNDFDKHESNDGEYYVALVEGIVDILGVSEEISSILDLHKFIEDNDIVLGNSFKAVADLGLNEISEFISRDDLTGVLARYAMKNGLPYIIDNVSANSIDPSILNDEVLNTPLADLYGVDSRYVDVFLADHAAIYKASIERDLNDLRDPSQIFDVPVYHKNLVSDEEFISGQINYPDQGSYEKNKVSNLIIGDEYNNKIVAGNLDDRLYGGLGADEILGGSGSDLIFGGKGDDLLLSNNYDNAQDGASDQLHGGKGEDTYYLGGGDNAYDSEGDDIYYVNTDGSGDLRTVIEDSDKKGTLFLGGNVIKYLGYESYNKWVYGEFRFSIKSGSLVATKNGVAVAEIRNFVNGDLGITLGDNINDLDLQILDLFDNKDNKYSASYNEINEKIAIKGRLHEGGSGSDIISSSHGDDFVFAGSRADFVNLLNARTTENSTGNDAIGGGLGNDVLIGNRSSNWLSGGEGDDHLFGGGGNDYVFGDSERMPYETYDYSARGELIHERHVASQRRYLNPENSGDDFLYGGDGNDVIYGQKGNDYIFGEDGDDILQGDIINYSSSGGGNVYYGDDFVFGGEGEDSIEGHAGKDRLFGGDDNDLIAGDAYYSLLSKEHHDDDVLYGDSGDDILIGQGGSDRLFGGVGSDSLYGDYGDRSLGNTGDDSLFGGDGSDYLYGEAGDDELIGGSGVDYLEGGTGRDVYKFYRGDARVEGAIIESVNDNPGEGNTIVFDSTIKPDDIKVQVIDSDVYVSYFDERFIINSGIDGVIRNFRFDSDNQIISLSGLIASSNSQNGVQHGTDENDVLIGESGKNELFGGKGNDELYGAPGVNYLYGEAGNDILTSQGGDDELRGGEGNDDYVVNLRSGSFVFIDDSEGKNSLTINDPNTSQVRFVKSGNGLLIVTDTGRVMIGNWDPAAFEKYTLPGGTELDSTQLNLLVNEAPIPGSSTTIKAVEDASFSYYLKVGLFNDPEGDDLSYTVTLPNDEELPQWLTYDAATNRLYGTPKNDDVGDLILKVTATDHGGLTATNTITIEIQNINDAPIAVDDVVLPSVTGLASSYTSDFDQAFDLKQPFNFSNYQSEVYFKELAGRKLLFWKTESGGANKESTGWWFQEIDNSGFPIGAATQLNIGSRPVTKIEESEGRIVVISEGKFDHFGEVVDPPYALFIDSNLNLSELTELDPSDFLLKGETLPGGELRVQLQEIPSDGYLAAKVTKRSGEEVGEYGFNALLSEQFPGIYLENKDFGVIPVNDTNFFVTATVVILPFLTDAKSRS